MRVSRTLPPEAALVGGQGDLLKIESPGMGCEEGRRTKRTWGAFGLNFTEIPINNRHLEEKYDVLWR